MAPEEGERGPKEGAAGATDAEDARPRPELRWVQLRDARGAAELGRNGQVVGRYFHEGYDAWELLLVTDEAEVDD
jgi:hypothetical protein